MLASLPFLRGLPASDLLALSRRCHVRRVPKGGTIFDEGAPALGLFVILDGRVKLIRMSEKGREQILHAEGAGATLGEVPLFDGGGYLASAVAVEAVQLLFVPRDSLLGLARRRPDVALGIIRVLAGRLRKFAALIEALALRDVTARLASLLLDEAHRTTGADFRLPGTRDDIAAQLGTVRELVSRSLSRLRAEGIIELIDHRVRVRQLQRLAALAGQRDG